MADPLTYGDGWQGGEEEVVEHEVHLVDHDGAGESAVELEPEVGEDEGGVLVEEVEDHPGEAVVVPVAVHEQQPHEVLEARDGEVGGHDGLRARMGICST